MLGKVISTPSPPPGPLSSPFSVKDQGISKYQSPPRVADLRSSFHVLSSDLDLDVDKTCSRRVRKLPSPTFDSPDEARLSGDACEESDTGGQSTWGSRGWRNKSQGFFYKNRKNNNNN